MINNVSITIFERHFDLLVEYDHYADPSLMKKLEASLLRFLSHDEWIVNAKSQLENYCQEDVLQDKENQKKDNVFSYIKPECIYVKRDSIRVAIMCHYRYDPEHGLAIVFDSDGNVTVGIQDIII